MTTMERPVRHGMLTKRSISKSKTTFNAKFQERWFVLTDKTLTYHTPNGHTEKGRISVSCIRCCEEVDEAAFNRPRLFQIVYSDKDKLRALYLQSETRQSHDDWIQSIRLVTERCCPEKMLRHYHKGAYLKKHWTCCRKTDKYDSGCCNSYIQGRGPELGGLADNRRSFCADPAVEQEKLTSTIKRKLSLQNMINSIKSSDSSAKMPSVSSEPSSTHEEEEDVFSDDEVSEDEFSSFRMKNSLDSSGNSPRSGQFFS